MPELLVTDPCCSKRNDFRLLDYCADFYQEIANIKQAMKSKTLANYLSQSGVPAPEKPLDFANYVSVRLLDILRQQERDIRQYATLYELNIYQVARYLMAALADEIFILELQDSNEWPGRSAWPYVLLEQKLFCSNIAGAKVFSLAEKLLQTQSQDALHIDLAGVFLLTFKLGFSGRYRGENGKEKLTELRRKLFQFTKRKSQFTTTQDSNSFAITEPAFSQAYHYRLQGEQAQRDQRLGALSPWKSIGIIALLAYLVSSCLIWMWLVSPFENYING
jgi:type VI secretion system protein ImpK